MTPNPERRNPQRLARDAERAQQVAASLARIADDVAPPLGTDPGDAGTLRVGGALAVQQEVADALESEGAAGIARDAATDELDALDLEGASFLMLRDFIRPMGVRK